jgi:hypothetical protein
VSASVASTRSRRDNARDTNALWRGARSAKSSSDWRGLPAAGAQRLERCPGPRLERGAPLRGGGVPEVQRRWLLVGDDPAEHHAIACGVVPEVQRGGALPLHGVELLHTHARQLAAGPRRAQPALGRATLASAVRTSPLSWGSASPHSAESSLPESPMRPPIGPRPSSRRRQPSVGAGASKRHRTSVSTSRGEARWSRGWPRATRPRRAAPPAAAASGALACCPRAPPPAPRARASHRLAGPAPSPPPASGAHAPRRGAAPRRCCGPPATLRRSGHARGRARRAARPGWCPRPRRAGPRSAGRGAGSRLRSRSRAPATALPVWEP